MDAPVEQIQKDVSKSVVEAPAAQRPTLTHLSADSAWLLAIPWIDTPPHGRSWFNILIDPWFKGIQVDYFKWFSRQWHVIEPSVQSISELNDRLKDREGLGECSSKNPRDVLQGQETSNPYIDAVIVSHEFTDHCNEGTLLQLHSSTPIFAKPAAAKIIRSWSHFSFVQDIPHFASTEPDWKSYTMDLLPTWLGIFRISQPLDISSTHSAVVICFPSDEDRSSESGVEPSASSEAVIYTPHGIPPRDLEILSHAFPPIQSLVLIHGLHEVFIGWLGQINLGAINGLKCRAQCSAKYYVPTHDEIKSGKGLIEYLLRRNALTMEEAVRQLKEKRTSHLLAVDQVDNIDKFTFVELSSGQSLVLS